MKLWMMVFILVGPMTGHALDKVIYGDDDRLEPYEVNGMFYDLAKSTAAMIPMDSLKEGSHNNYEVDYSPLSSRNICKDQKFSDQGTAAICSGFLVAPDVLITAGHCVTSEYYCKDYAWVFNYGLQYDGDRAYNDVSKEDVYRCKKIYAQELNNSTQMDFGIVILDRPVTNRNYLAINRSGKIPDRTPVVVIGHPTGLPTKIAGGAKVRDNKNSVFFNANLDTFGGNSGSAVFNEKTGEVVGILVRGETDYINDSAKGCQVVNKCSNTGCRGEDVTRIENIKQLQEILRDRGI